MTLSEEAREKMRKATMASWKDEAVRKRRSEGLSKSWTPERVKIQRQKMLGVKRGPLSQETKDKISATKKKNPAIISPRLLSLGVRRAYATKPEYREKISESARKQFEGDHRPIALQRLSNLLKVKGHKGYSHGFLKPLLEAAGYQPEFILDPYVADFALPETKTIVEIDGDTHRKTSVKKKDHKRDLFFHRKGWRVIHVKEWLWTKGE